MGTVTFDYSFAVSLLVEIKKIVHVNPMANMYNMLFERPMMTYILWQWQMTEGVILLTTFVIVI